MHCNIVSANAYNASSPTMSIDSDRPQTLKIDFSYSVDAEQKYVMATAFIDNGHIRGYTFLSI